MMQIQYSTVLITTSHFITICHHPVHQLYCQCLWNTLYLLQVVGRPGGGGESDAAFTPSPPVVAPDSSPCVATLTLTHQTRIRTLYSGIGDGTLPPTDNSVPGQIVPPIHHGM